MRTSCCLQQKGEQFMAKDQHGRYQPAHGKPSGNGRQGHGLSEAFAGSDPERDNELRANYMDEQTDRPAENVPVRHPNRHPHKGEDTPEYQQPPDNG